MCNPQNPVGRAWSFYELQELSSICLEHGVKIISDDVYCGLVHPGVKYTPIATISHETSMNTITCYSVSKTYNVTGDKHSYVVCENPEILAQYNTSLKKQNFDYGMNIFGLAITEAAYNHCDEWLAELVQYIVGNYELVQQVVDEKMELVDLAFAEATYFAWLDFRRTGLTREQLEKFFDDEANVSVVMGYKFLEGGEGFVRMNMGRSREMLNDGLDRIVAAYNTVSN